MWPATMHYWLLLHCSVSLLMYCLWTTYKPRRLPSQEMA